MDYEYDVALSFAGEERDYVESVAEHLRKHGVKVFYDEFEEVSMWGKDLAEHLDDIYRNKAQHCVIFISIHYANKVWPSHEKRSVLARSVIDREYILPARFDDTDVLGIPPSTVYIDLTKKTPDEFAKLIIEKIGKKVDTAKKDREEKYRKPKIEKKSFNPYDEAQKFIFFISTELKQRCDSLSGVSASVFNREGKTCIRVVHNGKTKYSLDMWMGGMTGDSGISFYGIQGEPSFSSGSTNAWGSIVWDKESDLLSLELHDISLLQYFSTEKRLYSYEIFLDTLWNKICNILESEQ